MFAELLEIKRLRENKEEAAMRAARAALDAAHAAVEAAKNAVEDYHTWRLAEEARLFAKVKGAAVRLKAIEEMNETIGTMRTKELALTEEISAREQEVPEAERALKEAEARHHDAKKATQKFEEFVAMQREEEARAAVEREDAELEEITEAIFAGRGGET